MDWIILISTFIFGFLFALLWRKAGESSIIEWLFAYSTLFLGILIAHRFSTWLWDFVGVL